MLDGDPKQRAATELQDFQTGTDVLRFLDVRNQVLQVLEQEEALLLKHLREIVPPELRDFMESYLGSGLEGDERGAAWLKALWRTREGGGPSTGSLSEEYFEECGFTNKADARRKLKQLQTAMKGMINFKFRWYEDGPFFELSWQLPEKRADAAKQ